MSKVKSSMHLNVPAAKVWELIGQFKALADWHPAVESSELEEGGKVRRLNLSGGGVIVERLEKLDDQSFRYRYAIEESPLPVSNYVSELQVREDENGSGSIVEWSSEFDPSGASATEAEDVIRGIYDAGLANLRMLFGGR